METPPKPPVKIRPIRILGTPLFDGGQVVASRGIAADFADRSEDLHPFLDRHFCGDWGDLDEEDTDRNDEALFDGSRILSAYHLDEKKVWIITEAEDDLGKRSVTTVLYPSEY